MRHDILPDKGRTTMTSVSTIGTALSGLRASIARLEAMAANLANLNTFGPTPGFSPSAGSGEAPAPKAEEGANLTGFGSLTQSYPAGLEAASSSSGGDTAVSGNNSGEGSVEQITARLAYDANLEYIRAAEQAQQLAKSALDMKA
jgi:flagellar basal body rod protein FlgC